MSFSLGTFLRKVGGTAVGVAETVPGLGTAVKVGEAIEKHIFPSGTGSSGVNMPAIAAAGAATVLPAAALVAHEIRKHRHHRHPGRHRAHRATYYAPRPGKKHHKMHHKGKKGRMPPALKKYWATHKRRAA